jgi:hypothetical protein
MVVAIINAQASLLLLSWCGCPCCDDVAVIDTQASLQSRHLCCHCDNVVALAVMASLHCQAGVVTLVMMVVLPLSMHSIFAVVMIVLLPLLCWHHCQHCTGIVALVAPALLSLLC